MQLCQDRLPCDHKSRVIRSIIASFIARELKLLPACSHTPELLRLVATDPCPLSGKPGSRKWQIRSCHLNCCSWIFPFLINLTCAQKGAFHILFIWHIFSFFFPQARGKGWSAYLFSNIAHQDRTASQWELDSNLALDSDSCQSNV